MAPDEFALCNFAVKLTLDPAGMGPSDLDSLRAHGFSDQQITVATQVVGYFNYINRVADGLGVDDEPWMDLSHDQWQQQKATFG